MACAGKVRTLFLSALFCLGLSSCSGAQSSLTLPPVSIYNGGKVIFVSPKGSDKNSGLSSKKPLRHISKALELAQPGDTVVLLPGHYREKVKTVRDGTPDRPITIIGSPGAVIYGNDKPGGKVVEVKNSFIQLLHLKVNGHFLNCEGRECYHDKLIYVHGSPENPLEGIRILSVELKNALGECLRLKYLKNSEVGWSSISHCGLRDYRFNRGKQNGEGIYVGTAPEQSRGKPDRTTRIYIHHNTIATYGAECIDVKENSTGVIIENNLCIKTLQKTSGGISVRGNENLIERNIVADNAGSGIRLGGDTEEFGIYNQVVENYLDNNRKYGLKIMRNPQKKVCGNVITEGEGKPIYSKSKKYEGAFKPCGR